MQRASGPPRKVMKQSKGVGRFSTPEPCWVENVFIFSGGLSLPSVRRATAGSLWPWNIKELEATIAASGDSRSVLCLWTCYVKPSAAFCFGFLFLLVVSMYKQQYVLHTMENVLFQQIAMRRGKIIKKKKKLLP